MRLLPKRDLLRLSLSSEGSLVPMSRFVFTVVGTLAGWTIVCHAVALIRGPLYLTWLLGAISFVPVLLCWKPLANVRALGNALPIEATRFSDCWLPIALMPACLVLSYSGPYWAFWTSAVVGPLIGWLRQLKIDVADLPPLGLNGGHRIPVLLLAVASLTITLVSHRPDPDDSFYIGVAVGALDQPEKPPGELDTLHGIAGMPVATPTIRLHSIELLAAALSRLSTLPVIYIMHLVFPSIFSFLTPFAWYLFFAALGVRHRALACACTLAVLILSGETHHSYGNFGFVRLFQGKAVFVTVIVPIISGYAVRWMALGDRIDLACLALAQIAAVGLTSNAIYLGPLCAGLALAGTWRPDRAQGRRLVFGLSTTAYPVACGCALLLSRAVDPFGITSRPAASDLFDVFGSGLQRVLFLSTVLMGGSLLCMQRQRLFLYANAVLFLGLLFNPWLATTWAKYVTGNINWRLAWAIPLVPLTGLLTAQLLIKLFQRPYAALLAMLVGIIYAAHAGLMQNSTLSARNRTKLTWPSLKVPERRFAVAGAVSALASKKLVLVPGDIAVWIVTQSDHSYPVVVRPSYLSPSCADAFSAERARRRALYDYLIGATAQPSARALVEEAIAGHEVHVVIVPKESSNRESIKETLRQAGFWRGDLSGYEVWLAPSVRRRELSITSETPEIVP